MSVLGGAGCGEDPLAGPEPPVLLGNVDEASAAQVFGLVIDASVQGLLHHHEASASQVPDLAAIVDGQPREDADADVGHTHDSCVDVVKVFDEELRLLAIDTQYERCTDGRDGSIDVRHAYVYDETDPAPTTQDTTQEIIFAGFRDGRVELEGMLAWHVSAPLGDGPVTIMELGDLEVDLDVTEEVELGDVRVIIPIETTHTLTMAADPEAGTVMIAGTAMVSAQGLEAELAIDATWSADACSGGGWSAGGVTLTSGGDSAQLTLDCGIAASKPARYDQAAVTSLKNRASACQGCDLTDANLTGADLRIVDLTGADCSRAFFKNAFGSLAKFNNATLFRASGVGFDCRLCDFTGADMSEGTWINTLFVGVHLVDVDLSASFLHGADLRSADFTRADLTGAGVSKATNVSLATWSNTTCPDGTNSDANGGTCCGHFTNSARPIGCPQ